MRRITIAEREKESELTDALVSIATATTDVSGNGQDRCSAPEKEGPSINLVILQNGPHTIRSDPPGSLEVNVPNPVRLGKPGLGKRELTPFMGIPYMDADDMPFFFIPLLPAVDQTFYSPKKGRCTAVDRRGSRQQLPPASSPASVTCLQLRGKTMKKYGLELRVPPSQQKKQPTRPRPPLAGFRDDDDEDDAAERAVSQQTIRSRALKEIEEQQQKALEEDPTIFDYDGVYDKLKQEVARPRALDREERKPKYIMSLKKSVERRQREHEIIYERQIAKERSKDDHLYADKDKFVTSAYKRKLAEQDKWKEEERLRELREEKEDVTKKSDLSDFYFNLSKNVAFGSRGFESKKPEKHPESSKPAEKKEEVAPDAPEGSGHISPGPSSRVKPSRAREANKPDVPAAPKIEPENKPQVYPAPRIEPADAKHVPDVPSSQQKDSTEPPPSDQPKGNHHKRSEDAVAAAKERFLARKRAKESL
ncbi:hypothetical protein CRG98_006313 [Punica granatum]|uniref:Nuclear speckle splicing regulatory protein 1 N-terminal domain-containing protein n=1 Tax=Punica granatum TaxID=22663 RepID=A0A2I0KY32_PUNGR|nr:hypothetical protein CRG98_006313 [Punica granatum]